MNFKTVVKKEFYDLIYSYKSLLTVFIAILGEKLILHIYDSEPYSIYFHSWFITTALQQFIYDSFLTDIKEKGFLFYQNTKVPFIMFFLSKFLICVLLYLFMFLCEIKNIMVEASLFQFICLSLQGFIAMPIMFVASVVLKQSETGGLILTTILMALIIFGLQFVPFLWLSFIITIILFVISVFLSYKVYQSLLFRKQI